MSHFGAAKRTWNRLWKSRRFKYFLAFVIFVGALAVVFSEGLMTVAMKTDDGWVTDKVNDVVGNNTGIVLLGHVFNVDIPSRQAQISWLILGCGDLKLAGTQDYSSGACGTLVGQVNFFVDGAADPTYTYNLQANALKPGKGIPIFIQAMQGFTTNHLLILYAWKGLDQQYGYPFDGYQLDTMLVALDATTNQSLSILGAFPISCTNNFWPELSFDMETESYNATGGLISSRAMEVAFSRTGFEKTYVMTLFLVNWALTAVVAFITVSSWVEKEISESILLLPISVILTIPALRALWDGAPAFGLLLDSCGTFLQMVVVSICSCFLVIQLAIQAREKKAEGASPMQAAPAVNMPSYPTNFPGFVGAGMREKPTTRQDDNEPEADVVVPLLNQGRSGVQRQYSSSSWTASPATKETAV